MKGITFGTGVYTDLFSRGDPNKLSETGVKALKNGATVDLAMLRDLAGKRFHLGFVSFERSRGFDGKPTITIKRSYFGADGKVNVNPEKNEVMRDLVARSFGPAMKYMKPSRSSAICFIRRLLARTA